MGALTMPGFLLSRRPLNLGTVSRVMLLAVAAAIVGVLAGRVAISHYGPVAIEALIGIPIVILMAPRPFIPAIALVAVLASLFNYGALPRVNMPGHPPINLADVLLGVAVCGTIWRRPWRTWPTSVQRYSLGLMVLVGLACISSVEIALHGAVPAREAALGLRNILYLALPLTIALELSGKLWRPLLNAAIIFAAIVSAISIAGAASHSVAHWLTGISAGSVMNVSFGGALGSTSRVRVPGLFFAYAMAIPTLAMVLTVHDRWRKLRIVALVLMVGAVLVSLNRNMYFGGLVGLVVTLLVAGGNFRNRALVMLIAAIASLVLVVSAFKPGVASTITARAGSGLTTEVLASGSAQARALEYHFAFKSISANPLDGVGWMQDYGLESGTGTGQRVFVENFYLHFATDYGIPAAVAFLGLMAFLLRLGVSRARRAIDPTDRALLAACVGGLVALLLSCLVGTYLQAPDSMISLAAVSGLLLAGAVRTTTGQPAR